MFCQNCGYTLSDANLAFCPNCGVAIATQQNPNYTHGNPPQDPNYTHGNPPLDPNYTHGTPPLDPNYMHGNPPLDPNYMHGNPPQNPNYTHGTPPQYGNYSVPRAGKGKAIAALVLGIAAMVIPIPILDIVFGVVGLSLAISSKNDGFTGGLRTAGLVCSIIGIVWATAFNISVCSGAAMYSLW